MTQPAPSPLTADEVALVTALLRGLTDARAQASLGWSERTYRRRVRTLMDKLHATSRFQAGFLLGRSGWWAHAVETGQHATAGAGARPLNHEGQPR